MSGVGSARISAIDRPTGSGVGPATRRSNIWWIPFFAALLALGVTMLRRETALEFPATTEDAHEAEKTHVIDKTA